MGGIYLTPVEICNEWTFFTFLCCDTLAMLAKSLFCSLLTFMLHLQKMLCTILFVYNKVTPLKQKA